MKRLVLCFSVLICSFFIVLGSPILPQSMDYILRINPVGFSEIEAFKELSIPLTDTDIYLFGKTGIGENVFYKDILDIFEGVQAINEDKLVMEILNVFLSYPAVLAFEESFFETVSTALDFKEKSEDNFYGEFIMAGNPRSLNFYYVNFNGYVYITTYRYLLDFVDLCRRGVIKAYNFSDKYSEYAVSYHTSYFKPLSSVFHYLGDIFGKELCEEYHLKLTQEGLYAEVLINKEIEEYEKLFLKADFLEGLSVLKDADIVVSVKKEYFDIIRSIANENEPVMEYLKLLVQQRAILSVKGTISGIEDISSIEKLYLSFYLSKENADIVKNEFEEALSMSFMNDGENYIIFDQDRNIFLSLKIEGGIGQLKYCKDASDFFETESILEQAGSLKLEDLLYYEDETGGISFLKVFTEESSSKKISLSVSYNHIINFLTDIIVSTFINKDIDDEIPEIDWNRYSEDEKNDFGWKLFDLFSAVNVLKNSDETAVLDKESLYNKDLLNYELYELNDFSVRKFMDYDGQETFEIFYKGNTAGYINDYEVFDYLYSSSEYLIVEIDRENLTVSVRWTK
ncbi:MAG TPA: hypothetical protein PKH64_11045 [Petrotogaceae bacterium]|nr:hypothetical protein [Petrotogaceae bacterium]HNV06647.1 hypothetical protein [Petrotogaceae bacterium]HPO25917.1 hypothetical protein [Petrotogaceae bacterium]HQC41482.1 hypothetical protein [Petrotogaceae bacterium]